MAFEIRKNGRLAITPTFLPLCLAQVIDVAPSEGLSITTRIPGNKKFFAFFRGLSYAQNGSVYFTQSVVNGYWVLTFHYGMAYVGIRVYIFSDMLPNVPNNGFYVFNAGNMVWHSNCLPLRVRPYSALGGVTVLNYPVAVPSAICNFTSVGNNIEHWDRWFVFMAGVAPSGSYNIGQAIFSEANVAGPPNLSSYSIPQNCYIETSVYDQYFSIALA